MSEELMDKFKQLANNIYEDLHKLYTIIKSKHHSNIFVPDAIDGENIILKDELQLQESGSSKRN